nr:DUF3995 domain-containing protein [Echinicola vietnamensis]
MSIVLSCILLGLGLIHFNWVVGGTFGLEEAIPTKENGDLVMNPGKVDSAIVGLGLTVFGLFYLIRAEILEINLSSGLMNSVGWIIPVIFLLRAMGEFKYVGFFKKVKSTPFGKWDTKLFSPLCLFMGILGILIQLF